MQCKQFLWLDSFPEQSRLLSMQGGVAGLKRKASQMSGASFGSAISRGSAASGGSADSKVRHVASHNGL